LFERLHLRGALLAAAAVDVEVGEDAEQPRAEVRPGCVRAPAAKGASVRLLHQVLRLLAAADESPRHAVDLIRELKRFLLEAHAVACVSCQSLGLGRRDLAHLPHPSNAFPKTANARESRDIPR